VQIEPFPPPEPPQQRPVFVPRPAEPPVPVLLLPLVGVNRLFDGFVLFFGPFGRALRSPAGRNLLGYSGLLMLLGGLAWGALDYFGWTW
jgi:hypothetical protein